MRNLLIFGLLFFVFSSNPTFSQVGFENNSSLYYGRGFSNFSSMSTTGIMKKGAYMVFLPYTGTLITNKNKLTFVKPQSIVNIKGKLKDIPFYFCESEAVIGFIRTDNISIIDEENLNNLLNQKTIYLKKPLLINNTTFPVATELRYEKEERGFYVVNIWDDGFKKAYIKKSYGIKKLKATSNNFKKNSKIFLGYPYSWGGSEEGLDCSYLVRDFYSLFDIKFPRNSFQQITSVENIDVSNLNLKEKKRLLKKSKPFETLLYFPGHIMIYAGFKSGEPIGFQALNRVDNRYYRKVHFFPLTKTGLLKRVTKIGYLPIGQQANLTISKREDKIQSRGKN